MESSPPLSDERGTITKVYTRPRLLFQLPYTRADVYAIDKMERWFLGQGNNPQRPLLCSARQEHPLAFFNLVPFQRRAGMFHQHRSWLHREEKSPAACLLHAWIETTRQFPAASLLTTSKEFNRATRMAAKQRHFSLPLDNNTGQRNGVWISNDALPGHTNGGRDQLLSPLPETHQRTAPTRQSLLPCSGLPPMRRQGRY